jgi:3-oxoacyl-[acyl-carrier-protein] synthase-1
MNKIYLNELGVLCALGRGKAEVARNLFAGDAPGMRVTARYSPAYLAQRELMLGQVLGELPPLASDNSRNNQLLSAALAQIRPAVDALLARLAPERIGVVIGTSTSGMAEAEQAMRQRVSAGSFPKNFHYDQQALGSASSFLADVLGIGGPSYTVSTACSSGVKVLASAQRLIQAGICDAVLAGGVDTLCGFTIAGFSSLESVSAARCNPFSANRCGINIGEGAALFLVSATPSAIALCGVGESSDGYHISAPEPTGRGARLALQGALDQARLQASDIDYLNLHATATPQNDAMEARVVHEIFGADLPCSGTKPLTGHTLGAAGALETAFCWLALSAENPENRLPPHLWDGVPDAALPRLHLVAPGERAARLRYAMSSSFAFGGNNAAVILGRNG